MRICGSEWLNEQVCDIGYGDALAEEYVNASLDEWMREVEWVEILDEWMSHKMSEFALLQ